MRSLATMMVSCKLYKFNLGLIFKCKPLPIRRTIFFPHNSAAMTVYAAGYGHNATFNRRAQLLC